MVKYTPVGATILTNLDCNLNCSYCYEHNKYSKINSEDKVLEFIEFIYRKTFIENGKNSKVNFHLIGGEPFVHPELIELICAQALEMNNYYGIYNLPSIYISTNGTLIHIPKILNNIIIKFKDVLKLGFSIDGIKETHDKYRKDLFGNNTWDQSIKNLKLALNILGPEHCGCKCTYNHSTINSWYEGVKTLIDLGVRQLNANYITEEIWPEEEAPMIFNQFSKTIDYIFDKDLYDQVKISQLSNGPVQQAVNFSIANDGSTHCRTCNSIKNKLCLGFDGLLYPCHRFASLNDPKFALGYLEHGSAVLTNIKLKQQIDQFCTIASLPVKCQNCDLKYHCYTCSEAYFEKYSENPCNALHTQDPPLCAWAIAICAAKLYFRKKLRAMIGMDPDSEENIQLLKHENLNNRL